MLGGYSVNSWPARFRSWIDFAEAPVEVAQRPVTRSGYSWRVASGGTTVIHSQCGAPLARARGPRTMGGPIDPAGDGVDRRGGTPNE